MKDTVAETSSALTPEEKHRLDLLEGKIKSGIRTFKMVGDALLEIKEEQLYREHYTDFGQYCDEHWGLSRSHAERLVLASRVIKVLSPLGVVPKSERSMRPLFDLEDDDKKRVWKAVLKKTHNPKKITGALVTEVKHQLFGTNGNGNGNGHHKPKKSESINRKALCADLREWYDASKNLHRLRGEALVCEVIKYIKRYV